MLFNMLYEDIFSKIFSIAIFLSYRVLRTTSSDTRLSGQLSAAGTLPESTRRPDRRTYQDVFSSIVPIPAGKVPGRPG